MAGLYTIGCSTLSFQDFTRNLLDNGVNVIADVRSNPYSKITPYFNREKLEHELKKNKILYVDFSKEFGARRMEFSVYENGQVSFEKTKDLPIFSKGIQRIEKGLAMGYTIALMCTEKNPLDCHRFSLVSRGIFEKTGILSKHILSSGKIKTAEEVESEMLRLFDFENDLFLDRNMQIKRAYELLNKKIGYRSLPQEEIADNVEEAVAENIYMFG